MVAVVTGGAGGIGLALSRHLGRRGVRVVVADVERPALDVAVDDLVSSGIEARGVECDVSSEASVGDLADEAFDWSGQVNILCNNAGVVAFGSAFESLDDWRWVIDVDMWGVVHGCHAFVPRMLESGAPGHVVNTASTAGLLGFPRIASYVAAKHAVVGMSQAMFHELRPTAVSMSVLCPGVVNTRINSSDRNRPGSEPPAAAEPRIGADHDETMTPEQVAEIVADSIEQDRFWILPHEHYGQQALANARGRIDGSAPVMPNVR
jgi:NAD(P)-dependent dehydrogenase (short-subunit alcohol dehydrogenase family)